MKSHSLRLVDFTDGDGDPTTGLVPVGSASNTLNLETDEKVALFEAELFEHIGFVFFRRFSDGRSSQISAYVVDNSDEHLNEKELAELHLKVWLHGTAPLLYIAWPSRIDVLTCARGPDFWESDAKECQYNPVDKIDSKTLRTAGAINVELQRFSALGLADGTFWEEPINKELADHNKAAHQSLIQAVVEADSELDGEEKPILRRLLLLMVLIKYLEDRRVFPNGGWFGEFHKGAKSFFDVLRGGKPENVYNLLNFLEQKFNGDIFTVRREDITKPILETFSDVVEARTLNKQRYLWQQFSFEHLPVEIISHLYQRFVKGGHGTVYTPPFLASLLLNHAMPYNKLTGNERVLDPACGSGVFLVGAFRRLVNVWRSRNNWQRPDVDTLKRILKESIYGFELDAGAIDLTAFSLSLAICDALQPDVIWGDLKFDYLRESNLFGVDFFSAIIGPEKIEFNPCKEDFEIIIGNPPFESKLSPAGEEANSIAKQHNTERGELPDKQVAYLFLEQALNLLRPSGQICLIQPSDLLHNDKTKNFFRNAIARKCRIKAILDFTSIRNLYEADPKTIAILAEKGIPEGDNLIAHWTFRRTVSVHERICFELDHYDRHRITQRQAEEFPFIWRVNLLGGGRLLDISQRLRDIRKLAEFVRHKGWGYGEGFIAAKTGRRTPAPFLEGKPLLPTDALTDSGIDEAKISNVKERLFCSARTEDRYTTPLVLIKETDSLPIVFWDKGFIAYRHQIIGIHTPPSQVSDLHHFYEFLIKNHALYRFACTLNGTRSLVGKSTSILKRDIDILPYPEAAEEISLSFWENALCEDVLEYITSYVRLGQNSDLLRTAAEEQALRNYSSLFVRMLGSVYDNLKASAPVFLDGLICQPFYFGERPNLEWLAEHPEIELRKLVYYKENHSHLQTVRLLRIYSENVLLLIKPDRLRYWIRSTAVRDADETLLDLRKQGY
ncbi:HsdM family class I SAM-dependent methyltransferase [Candidatus Thiosymbion oneisti]|uniref:HsdM family class I SAM-dependent methyltransferase n=1 Tax=Candidatus Thiosymbion oneisti TaxID=589554 RepID=UPI000B7EAAF3|nr:N-6 DNA methylase [Candidatus Thiosymbion oneisti]